MSGWAAKQKKKAAFAEQRMLDGLDGPAERVVNDAKDSAMGKGEESLFGKKLSKEDAKKEKEAKKAEAKAKRDAKKAEKAAAKGEALPKKKKKDAAAEPKDGAPRADESEADRLAREEHIIATFAHQKASHAHAPGQQKRAKFPTSKAPISAIFHSFRLIFGRAIISRNGLEAWVLFPERARAEHSR